MLANIGEDIYKTWSDDQRRSEIGKLVEGHRSGLPLEIMFQMASAIAGSPDSAREHLAALIPAEERHRMVTRLKGTDQAVAASFLM
jgi:hypothetical protein